MPVNEYASVVYPDNTCRAVRTSDLVPLGAARGHEDIVSGKPCRILSLHPDLASATAAAKVALQNNNLLRRDP